MQGSLLLRTVGTAVINQLGARQPMREIRRDVSGLYGRSLHRDHEGDWDFDLTWKPVESFAVYVGWLRAVRAGHARLQRGLDVPAPVLVLSSDRSAVPTEMGEDVHSTDIVLEVPRIRRWATAVGSLRHLRRGARRPARRGALPPGRTRAGVRGDRSLAPRLRRTHRVRPDPLSAPRGPRTPWCRRAR